MVKTLLRAIDGNNYNALVLLFATLELLNIILMNSVANVIVTIPQFLLVFYFIKKDIPLAFLLHVLFTLTAFDNTSVEYDGDMYSYSECKLVGPFTLSYVNLGLIWLQLQKQKPICGDSLILYFRKAIAILLIVASLIGMMGLLFLGYRFYDFFIPFNYLFIAFLYIDIFCRIGNPIFIKRVYICALCLILAAPIATFISFFILNLRATYSELDALLINEEFMLAPLMLLFLVSKTTPRNITLISLSLYFVCITTSARGGFFYNLAASMIACVYYIYVVGTDYKFLKLIIPAIVFVIISLFLGFTFENADNLALLKFNDFYTLITTLGSLNLSAISADNIATSPFIRVAELCNIIGCGINDPLAFIVGRGFGGQYTDITHMFTQIDLSTGAGAFDDVSLKTGRFGYAHSFLPMTLLWSGLIGLYYILKLGIRFIRRVKFSPLFFSAFTLFFYSFYFNPSIFLAVVFALFGANYKMESKRVYNER